LRAGAAFFADFFFAFAFFAMIILPICCQSRIPSAPVGNRSASLLRTPALSSLPRKGSPPPAADAPGACPDAARP
jgi:hypothetical protein